MKQPASAEIIIYRTKSKLFSGKTLNICLDDRNIGTIYDDEQHHFSASACVHSVYINAGKLKSETLTLDSNVNPVIYLECGFNEPEIESIKSLTDIKDALSFLKDAIYLKEVDSSSVPAPGKVKSRFSRSIQRVLQKICIVMCVLGFLGFTNGFIVSWGKAFWVTSGTTLPLGYPGSIAVDSNDNIYVAADFYYRIQKYSPEGTFLRSWATRDNNPRIRINEYDQLELANDNRFRSHDDPDTLAVYDTEGNLVSKEVVENCYAEFGEECDRSCRDKNGNLYSVRNKFWWPHITKTTQSGIETTVVQSPWYLWLFNGPFPAWLFFAVGLVGAAKL
jgi:hypothetical protein